MNCRLLFRGILGLTIISSLGLYAQIAEDALRYSQTGLGVGAQTQSLAGTSVGIANDFSALFSNPAGLGQQREFEFSMGLSNFSANNDVSFDNSKISSSSNSLSIDNLGLVYPIATQRGSLTLAFGYGHVANYDGSAQFGGFNVGNSLTTNTNIISPDILSDIYLIDTLGRPFLNNGNLQQKAVVSEKGGMNHWSFGGSMEVSPNLFGGISLNFASGSYTYDCLYTENDTKNIYSVFPGDVNQFSYEQMYSDNLSGINALFGLLFRKEDKFSIGISLRTPTIYDVSEDYSQTYGSIFDNGQSYSVISAGSSSYRITTPMVISGGVSVYPLPWLMLAGDAEYTDWTQVSMESDDPVLDASLQQENQRATTLFRATTDLRGGAEVTLFDIGLKLRAGISWKPSPYAADANTHDYDQYYYTAGAGVQVDRNTWINLSCALGYQKSYRQTEDLFSIPGLVTSENINTSIVNVSLSYKF
ncbi:MAG: hypothetical protein WAV76_02755 [Bacteroidota bacterium]